MTTLGTKTKERPNKTKDPSDNWAALHSRETECAICQIAVVVGAEQIEKLRTIEPRDFYFDDTRFVFGEVLRMLDFGHPAGDSPAFISWFKSPECLERCKAAKLDDWYTDENGMTNPAYKIMEIIFKADLTGCGMVASAANLDFYIKELHRWRRARFLRLFGYEIIHRIEQNPMETDKHAKWAFSQLTRYCAKAGIQVNGETSGKQ